MAKELQDKKEFAQRAADWTARNLAPLAVAYEAYAGGSLGGQKGGVKPIARKVLEGFQNWEALARCVLREVVTALINKVNITSLSSKIGQSTGKLCNYDLEGAKQQIQVGYCLLEIASHVTGAFEIHQNLADRPNSVEGGLKVALGYELRVTSDAFLSDAVEYGRIGMPTYVKGVPTPWQDQKTGGAEGQTGGMVHGAGKVMQGVTAVTAPRLFESINAMQAVKFRTNPVTAKLVAEYDDKKAFAWLFEYYVKAGKDDETARRLAKEDARL